MSFQASFGKKCFIAVMTHQSVSVVCVRVFSQVVQADKLLVTPWASFVITSMYLHVSTKARVVFGFESTIRFLAFEYAEMTIFSSNRTSNVTRNPHFWKIRNQRIM